MAGISFIQKQGTHIRIIPKCSFVTQTVSARGVCTFMFRWLHEVPNRDTQASLAEDMVSHSPDPAALTKPSQSQECAQYARMTLFSSQLL